MPKVDLKYSFKYDLEQEQVVNRVDVKLKEKRYVGRLLVRDCVVLNEQISDQEALVYGRVNAESLLQKIEGVREYGERMRTRKPCYVRFQLATRHVGKEHNIVLNRESANGESFTRLYYTFHSNFLFLA